MFAILVAAFLEHRAPNFIPAAKSNDFCCMVAHSRIVSATTQGF
jgi:hypothetical protein